MKNPVPDETEEKGAEYRGGCVDEYGGKIAGTGGNIPEDDLLHGIVRIDIKHIDGAIGIQGKIQYKRNKAADEKQSGASQKTGPFG